jgi:stage II sporulation protein R
VGQTKRRKRSALREAAVLAVAAGLILFAGWGFSQETKAAKAYTPNNLMRQGNDAVPADKPTAMSAENLVRLHIRGNSNEGPDQQVKLKVRDALMLSFGKALDGLAGADEAGQALSKSLPEIERVAAECLKENGFSYGAKAAVRMDYFPDKQYEMASGGLLYLPAGQYKALVVDLGEGAGDNWWCVMYPPLCYLDLVQRAVLKYGGDSMAPAGAMQAAIVVDESQVKDVPVEVRSLLVDSLRSGFRRLADLWAKRWPGIASAQKVVAPAAP